ncbi:MAG: hypothetical protein DRQ47_11125 [Gammaproteobacteria bacterium]|nr:MAG: hypothetical protein DRQ47_11125 [Gammaproteobacteria bacterium]
MSTKCKNCIHQGEFNGEPTCDVYGVTEMVLNPDSYCEEFNPEPKVPSWFHQIFSLSEMDRLVIPLIAIAGSIGLILGYIIWGLFPD